MLICQCHIPEDNTTEIDFHQYLCHWDIQHNYELAHGSKNPDFTLYSDAQKREAVVVLDIKDMDLSKGDELALRTTGLVRDPSKKTRKKINVAVAQFSDVETLPCVLLLAPGEDHSPMPESVFAAMVGDMVVEYDVDKVADTLDMRFVYRGGRKMSPNTNTRISAIGIMSYIKPGEYMSGYIQMIHKYADQYLINGKYDKRGYSKACMKLKKRLTQDGHDLESFDIQIEYVLNPYAARLFPRYFLQKGYVKIWEIDKVDDTLACSYDWTEDLA